MHHSVCMCTCQHKQLLQAPDKPVTDPTSATQKPADEQGEQRATCTVLQCSFTAECPTSPGCKSSCACQHGDCMHVSRPASTVSTRYELPLSQATATPGALNPACICTAQHVITCRRLTLGPSGTHHARALAPLFSLGFQQPQYLVLNSASGLQAEGHCCCCCWLQVGWAPASTNGTDLEVDRTNLSMRIVSLSVHALSAAVRCRCTPGIEVLLPNKASVKPRCCMHMLFAQPAASTD